MRISDWSSDVCSSDLFGDGRSRYEPAPESHHDHLIDVETGKVLEFVDPELEQLQKQIAERLGFRLVDHRMELYGVALDRKNCRRRPAADRPAARGPRPRPHRLRRRPRAFASVPPAPPLPPLVPPGGHRGGGGHG